MRETADDKKRRRRRYPDTAEDTGKHLVMTELLRRGFEAEFAGASYEKHDMVVRVHGSTETYSHQDRAFGAMVRARGCVCQACGSGDGVRPSRGRNWNPARFFMVKNSDLAAEFRQPPTWKAFGFIDVKSVEKYEDNWDILK